MLKVKYDKGVGPLKMTVNGKSQNQVELNSINGSPRRLSGDAELIDHQPQKEEVPYGHHLAVP
jgi:hypothetical protein